MAEINKFLIFSLNLPKMHFGVEFHKIGNGFELSTIELCQVPSCGRNRQVFDFRPKFAQKGILGSNFIKLVTDSNSAPPNYARYQVVAEIREGPLFLKVQGPTFLRVRVQGPGPVYKVCQRQYGRTWIIIFCFSNHKLKC